MKDNRKIDINNYAIIKNNISYNYHIADNQRKMTTTIENKNKNPSSKFIDYLNKHRVSTLEKDGNSQVTTHLSMCYPLGKYSITDINTFMDLYDNEVKNGNKIGIVEKPLQHMELPLVSDIDFKYELKDETIPLSDLRKHNYKIIKEILLAYKKVYDEHFYFRHSDDKKHCNFFISQRQDPYIVESGNIKYVKDGFHIMNPGYRAFPKIHLLMRKQIIQDENLKKCIQSLGTIHTIENTIDEAVICKNGWLLYGSSKPDKDPYEIEYIFDFSLNEANKKELGITSYSKYLSYWRVNTKHAIPIKKTMDSFMKTQLIHSVSEDNQLTEDKDIGDIGYIGDSVKKNQYTEDEVGDIKNNQSKNEDSKKSKKKKIKKTIEIVEAENPDNSDTSMTGKIKLLVSMLSEKRGTNKSLWEEVGECLKVFSSDYLEIWIDFTKKYNNFTEDDCNEMENIFI